MTTNTSHCLSSTETSTSVIDSAATVWAVVTTAQGLPATPERRQELLELQARLNQLLATAGFYESDLRCHLERTRAEAHRPAQPPDNKGSQGPWTPRLIPSERHDERLGNWVIGPTE